MSSLWVTSCLHLPTLGSICAEGQRMNAFVLSLLMSLCRVTFELFSQLYHLRLPGFYLGPSACPKIPFIGLCFEIHSPQYDCGFVPVSAQNIEILAHDQISPWKHFSGALVRMIQGFIIIYANMGTANLCKSHQGEKEKLILSVTYLRKHWFGQRKGWKLRYMKAGMCGRWSTSSNQPKPRLCQSPPVSTKVARWQCTCENRWIKSS